MIVAVGGDYKAPEVRTGTAATAVVDAAGTVRWSAPTQLPGGYRSAVAYDLATATWVAVGTTGADISIDDGATWRPLTKPLVEAPGDIGWNAISLPFVVGPNGRIARLRLEGPRASQK